jgi:3-hydroxyisobutyrate dehydrogenase
MRARGEAVHVWNRSPEKARALEADGAVAFDDPAEAVRGAERVHLTLADDAAVDAVLERAAPGFAPGVLVIDHSTTSPAGTAARAGRWDARGVAFLHAPVMMGPHEARTSTGVMLCSGDPARFARARPELEKMAGTVLNLGPAPERAAAFKLMGNLFLISLVGSMVDMLNFGHALGFDAATAVGMVEQFNPTAQLVARARRILAKDFAHPSFELAMARKDVRLMLETAASKGATLATLPGIAARMDALLAEGLGAQDWLVIARDAL